MENNQRNSRKRLNSLILLVAFTAVMLIVSTYAWFSSQKNVTLSGLRGVVNVAEGLQISLDAQHWVNTIDFDDFNQSTPGAWTVDPTSTTTYLNSGATFQLPRGESGGITNITPTEFLPVSTTGYDGTGDGIGETAVKFYAGTNKEVVQLMDDTKLVTENASAGYFAFDLFLMNTSASDENDVLQLDPISDVTGDLESSGVQNTARVGFALYGNSGSDMNVTTVSNAYKNDPDGSLKAQAIIAGTSTSKTISDFAIWEPNANEHTSDIVSSNANSLKLDSGEFAKWSGLSSADSNGVSKFSTNTKIPTYALTSVSLPAAYNANAENIHIADVYDWRSTGAQGVKKQFTLQTDAYSGSDVTLRPRPVDLVSTKKLEANASATDTTFEIVPNQYQKIRVYVWMEGQDPDCINSASLGGGLTIDIGFSKPGSDTSSAS